MLSHLPISSLTLPLPLCLTDAASNNSSATSSCSSSERGSLHHAEHAFAATRARQRPRLLSGDSHRGSQSGLSQTSLASASLAESSLGSMAALEAHGHDDDALQHGRHHGSESSVGASAEYSESLPDYHVHVAESVSSVGSSRVVAKAGTASARGR